MRYALILLVTACAGKPLEDLEIACTADSECPHDAWCDLRYHNDVCLSLAHSAPPHIAFDGFVLGQQIVKTIWVPPKTTTIHTLRLRNDGGSQTDVIVKLDGPACLDAFSLTRGDGELLDEGDTLDADFDVDPAVGCASPAMITITATASDRVFSFPAMISISP